MTGLEKIIRKIEEKTAKACDLTINKAQADADKILAQAEESAREYEEDVLRTTEEKLAAIKIKEQSGSKQRAGQIILAARNSVLTACLEEALQAMLSLPQDDYFNSLHALALKYADEGSCFMHLNAADLKRLPDSFAGTLKADLKKKNCLLDMSNTAVDIKGGFILVYGDIEINCSFEALLAGREAELKDLIYKHIF